MQTNTGRQLVDAGLLAARDSASMASSSRGTQAAGRAGRMGVSASGGNDTIDPALRVNLFGHERTANFVGHGLRPSPVIRRGSRRLLSCCVRGSGQRTGGPQRNA